MRVSAVGIRTKLFKMRTKPDQNQKQETQHGKEQNETSSLQTICIGHE